MSPLSATFCHFLLAFQLLYTGRYSEASQYTISDASGLGRRFDGIGGLSGGGATSRLLVNYPELYQSQILDYLFKPNFGASLPILKVEIGGDSQSTDGTESSHMHSPNDENYQRGYEWWLMKEAKKRNPKIKLYGLPWAFPGWIGNGTQSPYVNVDVTADYIIKWIQGAKTYHNLTIDYIGIWNEMKYSASYIEELRATLNQNGLQNVQIVAADGKFRISYDILNSPALAKAVQIIGPYDISYIKALRATLNKAGFGHISVVAADGKLTISQDILKDKALAEAVQIIGFAQEVIKYVVPLKVPLLKAEIWNERPFDVGYIKVLRKTLDKKGLTGMQIVAADNLEFISIAIHNDPEIAKDVAVIGVHYPGTYVTNYTLETGKTIWASEDYSTFNNEVGAGCWARILNQNYVNGMMTCTISWNLLASYYDALPYKRDGLMTANEPWSGHYEVPDTIWITAHTTQFTGPGWMYLKHNTGVQHLEKGGSFVSMTNGTDLTIIIETMSHNHSICIRPYLPPYSVVAQTATFALQGNFANISSLNVWYSKLGFSGETSTMFVKKNPIKIMNGHFSMNLAPDEVYTLTTTEGGIKGTYPAPPPSAPFPVPYSDNFDIPAASDLSSHSINPEYPQFTEANNFADQAGVWEIRETGDPTHHMVMEQVVLQSPVHWCQAADTPISVVGNYSWINANVSIDVKLGDKTGAFLAQRVDKGGCQVISATGLFFIVYFNGTFSVYTDINRRSLLSSGEVSVKSGMWFNMQLLTQNNKAAGFVEGKMVFSTPLDPQKVPSHGFVAIGMPNYASAQFDNFSITSAS